MNANAQKLAACLGMDPDLFFPKYGGVKQEAVDACASCSVRSVCLDEHIMEEYGYFGGLTASERNDLRTDLGIQPPGPDIRHGTYTGYGQGCRQACCLEAKRLYVAGQRSDRRHQMQEVRLSA